MLPWKKEEVPVAPKKSKSLPKNYLKLFTCRIGPCRREA
jgi:hypothetical protein